MVEQKTFQISPKTSHESLVKLRWGDGKARVRVAEDIIANAKELEGGVDWSEILDRTFAIIHSEKRYTGRQAIANSIAATVGSIASNMSWSMHSPEIVYMSGYYFFWSTGKNIDTINKRLVAVDQRTFASEETREKTLHKEQADVVRLGMFRERLGESLDLYTRQSLATEDLDAYLEILQKLLYSGHTKLGPRRSLIFNFLRAGQIREARAILGENP